MFEDKIQIIDILKNLENFKDKIVVIYGWAKNIRDSKTLGFINLNDGSNLSGLQIVFEEKNIENFDEVKKINVGASLKIKGKLVLTPNAKQPCEIQASFIEILNSSAPEYPLQKKRHTLEYLRSISHLRPRTNTLSAVYRVRAKAAFAVHRFFNENNFFYINTPILTHNDCEGAGEMFSVTTLDMQNLPMNKNKVDYSKDFFGRQTSLTVSGQLEAECMAMALGNVYTFGPTFRAERSNTQRHAAEFWMIEPEMAFANLKDAMKIAGEMIRFVITYVLENCKEDIEFFNKFIDKGLLERLETIAGIDKFEYITYTKAIEVLEKNNDKFVYKAKWGCDLQTEHEKYLTEKVFKAPVFVIDYPKDIKAFYMKINKDKKTVAAMDLLMPEVGELLGGSQREDDYETLKGRMAQLNMNVEDYNWYLDLRKYGSCVHSGFGVGFERLVMYLTGVQNIRDVLPFPRTC